MLDFLEVQARTVNPNGTSTDTTLRRAKIPGGWLVTFYSTLTFVPDPEHRWDGSSLP